MALTGRVTPLLPDSHYPGSRNGRQVNAPARWEGETEEDLKVGPPVAALLQHRQSREDTFALVWRKRRRPSPEFGIQR
jgi:hypothetical protein